MFCRECPPPPSDRGILCPLTPRRPATYVARSVNRTLKRRDRRCYTRSSSEHLFGSSVVMTAESFRPGEKVEVNVAGLRPVAMTDVLLDLEAHGEWHPAEVLAALPDGTYIVHVTPLVGAMELPPVEAERLRRRGGT
jgi:hypothetical protein